MSFLSFNSTPLKTREQIAREVHQVSLSRGLDELATVMDLMCIAVEVGADDRNGDHQWWCPWNRADPQSEQFPHDSESNDSLSIGYHQQQVSRPGAPGTPWGWGGLYGDLEGCRKRMTLAGSADMFLAALTDDYRRAADNPTLAGEMVANVQQPNPAYRYRYAQHWDEAWSVLRSALKEDPPTPTPTQPGRPNFTEADVINNWRGKPYGQSQSRNGQAPRFIVLHTSEGAGGEGLLDYMQRNSVSYHDVIDDTGVDKATVWHLVDKNRAAWSVGNANNYTINYCFGTSFAIRHTRADWLRLQDDSIKALAWQVAQDCKRFGIAPTLRVGNSASGYPSLRTPGVTGITDHRGINVLAGGDHTDVGDQFPWSTFDSYLQKYYRNTGQDDFLMALSDAEQKELLEKTRYVYAELSKEFPSRSIYRTPNEGGVDTFAGMTLNVDSAVHADLVEQAAYRGDEDSIMRILRTASGEGAATDQWAVDRAKSALAEIPQEYVDAYLEVHGDR